MDTGRLEAWYLKHHRKLPFRESRNPYHIWVSEVMLQQTQVETVIPYFNRFIVKYPDVIALANADEESLHRDVEGLGYYRRFRMMRQAAILIRDRHQGVFPTTHEEILSLPGIGRYTAGAIMSIAYGKPHSALDGNVIRVLSRYLGNGDDMKDEKHRKKLDIYNQQMIEKATPEIYTQAMMELGALLCRPRKPKCMDCPLQDLCIAHQRNEEEMFPIMSKSKEKVMESYVTFLIWQGDHVLVRKRTESLLYGMYEYPQVVSESIPFALETLEDQGIVLEVISPIRHVRHVFTHRVWEMQVVEAKAMGAVPVEWIPIRKSELTSIPMAVAHRKITL